MKAYIFTKRDASTLKNRFFHTVPVSVDCRHRSERSVEINNYEMLRINNKLKI